MRFVLLPGQRFDTVGAPPLIEGLPLDARGAKIISSQHPRRIPPLAIDEEMYKWRRRIENFFAKLKEFDHRLARQQD